MLHYFDPTEPGATSNVVNNDLHWGAKYSENHNLKINPNKTQTLLLCQRNRRVILHDPTRKEHLQFSECSKNLSIYIDTNLSFSESIKRLLQIIYMKMKVMYSNRYI